LYGVPWPEIQRANNIPNANLIFAGQTSCIPAVGTPTATPRPGATPTPAPSPTRGPTRTPFVTPAFRIVSVVRDQSVTIQTANFPANQRFDVLMGAYSTQGINGTKVTTTDSGSGGTFSATYTIPAAFTGARRIAIRLQSASGFFSYNWFWNNSTP
ncbi:MAG: LysM peptidoglycan-binding domain-containing protein, partial [Anaerolineales bacterium]